jgi:hypothetical protein
MFIEWLFMKKTPKLLNYLLPQPRDILFIGVLLGVLYNGPTMFSSDGDSARHITVGNFIIDNKTVPTHDVFSHTMFGERFVPHEWLSEVVFSLANRLMGLNGVVLLTALLGSLTILLVYQEMIKRGNFRFVALFVATWVTFVSSIHWLARPHMFTFFFIALWTFWLEQTYQNKDRYLWRFPLLMLLWVNAHGAFITGFIVWGIYLADWLWEFVRGCSTKAKGKHLLLIGLFSFVVTFLNPSGWYLWRTIVGYLGNEFITNHIVDHLSPNFHLKSNWPFMFMVAFALFSLMQKSKIHLREALSLAGWTMMGLYSVRNIPLFAVITAPIYGKLIQPWAEKMRSFGRRSGVPSENELTLRGYVWIVVAVLFFGTVLWRGIPIDQKGTGNVFLADKMPVQAVNWLEENPQKGNMFNSFLWGGYILYRLWPEEKVFIDGEALFYGETLFREYLDVINLSDGWEKILDNHDVSWMLIPRDDVLAKHLFSNDKDMWKLIYADNTAAIFSRDVVMP